MKNELVTSSLIALIFISCKKDYICACSNANGVYARQTFHETKKKAKELCPKGMIMFMVYQPDSHCYLKN